MNTYKQLKCKKNVFVIYLLDISSYNYVLLNLIHKYFNFKNKEFQFFNFVEIVIKACVHNDIKILKFFCNAFTIKKYQIKNCVDRVLAYVCYKGNTKIVEYLHQKFNLETQKICANCGIVCEKGHDELLKYLHKKCNLCKYDVLQPVHSFYHDYNNEKIYNALTIACKNGYINILKYLHREFCLTKQDIIKFCKEAMSLAHYNHQYKIINYLHREFKIKKIRDYYSDSD